jgi:hypothetical protein
VDVMKKILTCVFVAALLAGCATKPEWNLQEKSLSVIDEIDFPEVGILISGTLGETLVAKGFNSYTPALRTKRDVTLQERSGVGGRVYLPSNSELFKKNIFIHTKSPTVLECYYGIQYTEDHMNYLSPVPPQEGCVIVELPGGELQTTWHAVFKNPGLGMGDFPPLDSSALQKFTKLDKLSDTFVQEFIYNGRLGNQLKFIYREFSGDYIRPAFTQEVQYDLSLSREIGFRELRLHVEEASNTSINYRVITTFP